MNLKDFHSRIITKGIRSIKKSYAPSDPCYEGGLEGFELCKDMSTPSHYEDRILIEYQNLNNFVEEARTSKEAAYQYKKIRYIILQIEYVYELMKVAWNNATPPFILFSGNQCKSYSSVRQYCRS
jgi:hypothetical protein